MTFPDGKSDNDAADVEEKPCDLGQSVDEKAPDDDA